MKIVTCLLALSVFCHFTSIAITLILFLVIDLPCLQCRCCEFKAVQSQFILPSLYCCRLRNLERYDKRLGTVTQLQPHLCSTPPSVPLQSAFRKKVRIYSLSLEADRLCLEHPRSSTSRAEEEAIHHLPLSCLSVRPFLLRSFRC